MNEIYINPDYTGGDNDGTINHPFTTIIGIPIENETTYLWKRGTTDDFGSAILIMEVKNNVIFGTYGEGDERAKIISDSSETGRGIIEHRGSHDIRIENLHISGAEWEEGKSRPAAVIMFMAHYTGIEVYNVEINNCKLEHAGWGIRGLGQEAHLSHDFFIHHCDISNTEDDGIFFYWTKDNTFEYNYIHDVNLKWFHVPGAQDPGASDDMAPGDCLQVSNGDGYFIVRHNILDRSNSGNKFCFIHAAGGGPHTATGVIEYNTFIAPLSVGAGGTHLYLSSRCQNVIIRYNRFLKSDGVQGGIYSTASETLAGFGHQVYYNIIENANNIRFSNSFSGDLNIHNNIFIDGTPTIRGHNVICKNNIFAGTTEEYGWSPTLTESNNCYSSGYIGNNSINSDPLFVDAENGDYNLQPESECINAGVNITEIEIPYDLDGNDISNPPNIGCYESVIVTYPDCVLVIYPENNAIGIEL